MNDCTILNILSALTGDEFAEIRDGKARHMNGEAIPQEHMLYHTVKPDGYYRIYACTCGDNSGCFVGRPNKNCKGISPTKCGVWVFVPIRKIIPMLKDLLDASRVAKDMMTDKQQKNNPSHSFTEGYDWKNDVRSAIPLPERNWELSYRECLKHLEYTGAQLTKAEAALKDMTFARDVWETLARLDSRLPCGHPNDCSYDIKGDGTWSHIGCVWCERDRFKLELARTCDAHRITIDGLSKTMAEVERLKAALALANKTLGYCCAGFEYDYAVAAANDITLTKDNNDGS
jgi:hypothetical protein